MVGNGNTAVIGIDPHDVVLCGLRCGVERAGGFTWGGSRRRLEGLELLGADAGEAVLIIDPRTPGGDAFEIIEEIGLRNKLARVLVLGVGVSPYLVDRSVSCGAWGCATKEDAIEDIVECVREIATGEHFVTGPGIRRVCGIVEQKPGAPAAEVYSSLGQLTPRELDVLRLIGEGMRRTEIADSMRRSAKTIDTHRAAIMGKLGIKDRGGLIRLAIREGLVDPWDGADGIA